ncbi:hypothetical protein CC79DRAFT_862241 [Sarocladium strictum]
MKTVLHHSGFAVGFLGICWTVLLRLLGRPVQQALWFLSLVHVRTPGADRHSQQRSIEEQHDRDSVSDFDWCPLGLDLKWGFSALRK